VAYVSQGNAAASLRSREFSLCPPLMLPSRAVSEATALVDGSEPPQTADAMQEAEACSPLEAELTEVRRLTQEFTSFIELFNPYGSKRKTLEELRHACAEAHNLFLQSGPTDNREIITRATVSLAQPLVEYIGDQLQALPPDLQAPFIMRVYGMLHDAPQRLHVTVLEHIERRGEDGSVMDTIDTLQGEFRKAHEVPLQERDGIIDGALRRFLEIMRTLVRSR